MLPVFEKQINRSCFSIYNEDCLEGMQKYIEPNSIDVVVTSPPYNIGKDYRNYNDTIPRDEYLDWLFDVCQVIV